VDHDSGRLIISNNLGWRDVPVRAILEQTFGMKTFVESEGRAIALGEYGFGAGKDAKNMLSVDIDAGIGAAVISNGQIYHGFHQMEGEFGHNVTLPDGPVCRCGRNGCLEALASGSAIIRQVAQSRQNGGQTAIPSNLLQMPEREAMRAIFAAAQGGFDPVLQILKMAGSHLGAAIADLVNHADPELVVLCGYVVEEDNGVFVPMIQEAFEKGVFGKELRKVLLVKSSLGEDAVLIGGATMAYQDMVQC
jgi:predicted NBD/HSP70 family sugar kinase